MVEDEDVQPRVLARVVVAAGAPVLPLPHLDTRVTCHKLSRVTCHEGSRGVRLPGRSSAPPTWSRCGRSTCCPRRTTPARSCGPRLDHADIIYIDCLIGASFCILQRRQQRHVGHDTAAYDGRRCAVITCNFPAPQYLCSHNVETFHSGPGHDTVDTMLHVASRG